MPYYPLVTVILPCYNHGKYVEESIRSVLAQTYKNVELIVIDNGSTDDSLQRILALRAVSNFKLIQLRENVRPGEVGGAVSIALKQATGEFVSILYSDDWYMPGKLEKQMLCMLHAPSSVGVVYCHGYRYFESTGVMKKWIMGSARGYVFHEYLRKGDLVISISPLVKKYCYDLIGTSHLWTGSEYDFFSMSQYVDFDYVDEYLVVMRDHDSNDAKNVLSVFQRVCSYDQEFFSSGATMMRAAKYASLRLSRTYLMFARDFAEVGDKRSARSAFFKALSSRPLCLCSVRGIIMVMYLLFPVSVFFGLMRLFRSVRSSLQLMPTNNTGRLD